MLIEILEKTHSNAFGIEIKKDKIQELTEYCNEHLKLSDLVTIHEVDYEVPAKKLKEKLKQKSHSIVCGNIQALLYFLQG